MEISSEMIEGAQFILLMIVAVGVLFRKGVPEADKIVGGAIQKRLDDEVQLRRDGERLDQILASQGQLLGIAVDGLISLGKELSKSTPIKSDDAAFEWMGKLRNVGAVIEDSIPADGEEVVKG